MPETGSGGLYFYAGINDKDFQAGAKRIKRANNSIKKSSGGASAAIVEIGRGASDARYGFHGLANNAERMTELFGNLVKTSGGFKGALKALGGAILGPAGIVAGISILIAYGPEIVGFFKKIITGADDAKTALEEFNEEQSKTSQSGLEKAVATTIADAEKELRKLAKTRKILLQQQRDTSAVDAQIKAQKKIISDAEAQLAQEENKKKVQSIIKKQKKEERELHEEITAENKFQLELAKAKGATEYELNLLEQDLLTKQLKQTANLKEQERIIRRIAILKAGLDTAAYGDTPKVKAANLIKKASFGRTDGSGKRDSVIGNFSFGRNDGKDPLEGITKPKVDEISSAFDDLNLAALGAGAAIGAINEALSSGDASGFKAFASSILGALQQVAFASAITAATKDSVKFGAVALPILIGAALGAVKSAFTSSGISGGPSPSTSSSYRAPQGGFVGTPNESALVEFRIGADALVGTLQNASRTRQTYTGSTFSVT